MPQPFAIVFDLGKVLVDFDYSIAARRIAPRARAGLDPGRFITHQAETVLRYETGLMTTPRFCREMCDAIGFSGTPDEFGELFADVFTAIPEMIDLHGALKQRGLPAY